MVARCGGTTTHTPRHPYKTHARTHTHTDGVGLVAGNWLGATNLIESEFPKLFPMHGYLCEGLITLRRAEKVVVYLLTSRPALRAAWQPSEKCIQFKHNSRNYFGSFYLVV